MSGTGTLTELLQRRGFEVAEPVLVRVVEGLLGPTLQPPSPGSLTEADEAFLSEHAGVARGARGGRRRGLARARDATVDRVADVVALVEHSVGTNELARRLGVDASRVRHRAASGGLYAVRVGRENRFPAWQFGPDGRPLPHLANVLGALDPSLHPLEVEAFFTTPQPELGAGEDVLDPRAWLLGGGDPEPVVEVAGALAAAV